MRFNPFHGGSTVRIAFATSIGVTRSGAATEVRIAGVEVGSVTAIDRDGDHALFTLRVSSSAAHALRADATAELRPRTPFEGTAFIDLHPGSADAPPLGGATIPLSHTSIYVGLYPALSFAVAAISFLAACGAVTSSR